MLLKRPENLDPTRNQPQRLEEALRLNEPLAIAYYLKEDLLHHSGFRGADPLDALVTLGLGASLQLQVVLARKLAGKGLEELDEVLLILFADLFLAHGLEHQREVRIVFAAGDHQGDGLFQGL